MPASPVPGNSPRASSPRGHRPAVQHRAAAHPRQRRQSYRLRDARSRSRAAAWPQAGQPAPEEEIIVTTGTPHAGPAARQARAATTAQAPRNLGLVLAVIATAQLMVALDLTIVNVALPHIRQALGFSGTNLEWVVNAYAVAFGGLLLLGGRAGDLLGRRRIFIAGLLVFSLASLLGGLATGQAWLIAARAVQGAGAAMAAPTALSLIAVTFPQGRARTRATAVYSAMAIVGIVAGLIAGGLLVTYLSWRWVMFVNVPIGLVVAALAARVLPETGRRGGRLDLPGALTATAGVAALVYGLSNAATTPDGVSHWGDAKVVASLAAAAVLLVAFGVIEARSSHPLLPFRVLQPGPVRGLPDQPVHRHRADRHVLLPHPVRAGGVAVQRTEDRRCLPVVRPGSPSH